MSSDMARILTTLQTFLTADKSAAEEEGTKGLIQPVEDRPDILGYVPLITIRAADKQ
jgi:hypothetical protein